MYNSSETNNSSEIFEKQKIVAKQLLIVKTELHKIMIDSSKELSKVLFTTENCNFLNNLFQNLHIKCKKFNNEEDVPFLKNIGIESKNYQSIFKKDQKRKIVVRETLMKRGFDGEGNPYKLHDVFLFALDLLYDNKSGFMSLSGILDIVVSIPGHIGFILEKDYKRLDILGKRKNRNNNNSNNSNTDPPNELYNITSNYFLEENIKMISYGLRTKNKKISKDLERFKLILKLMRRGLLLKHVIVLNKVIKKISNTNSQNVDFIRSINENFNEILSEIFLILSNFLIVKINISKSFFVPEIVPLMPSFAIKIVPKIILFLDKLPNFFLRFFISFNSLNL